MHIHHDVLLNAPPQQAMEYMLSEAFLEALTQGLDNVSDIEKLTHEQTQDKLARVLRYQAPTRNKLPKFLKKYEDKAPEFVYWKEVATWDLPNRAMSYTIEPEVPQQWTSYYDVSGSVAWTPEGQGTRMRATLTFDVNVFGLKRLIERALEPEVTRLMKVQGDLVQRHFA